jgi:hypothetical protein
MLLRKIEGHEMHGWNMLKTAAVMSAALLSFSVAARAEDLKLPPEVTPALRAACETDVRRLCVGTNPTVAKVKSCVRAKFMQLGNRCKMQIALAGLTPQ